MIKLQLKKKEAVKILQQLAAILVKTHMSAPASCFLCQLKPSVLTSAFSKKSQNWVAESASDQQKENFKQAVQEMKAKMAIVGGVSETAESLTQVQVEALSALQFNQNIFNNFYVQEDLNWSLKPGVKMRKDAFKNALQDLKRNLEIVENVSENAESLTHTQVEVFFDLGMEQDCMRVTTTDLNMMLSAHLEVDILDNKGDNALEFALPAREIMALLKGTTAETLQLCIEGDSVKVSFDNHQSRLSSSSYKDVPVLSCSDPLATFHVETPAFNQAIHQTALAMGVERGNYDGMLWHLHQDKLCCVATNKYILAYAVCPIQNKQEGEHRANVSRQTIQTLYRLLSESVEQVEIQLFDHMIKLQCGLYTLIAKQSFTQTLQYQPLIEVLEKPEFSVNKKAFEAVLSRAVIFADMDKRAELEFGKGELQVNVVNKSKEMHESVSLQLCSENTLKLAFNVVNYLKPVVGIVQGEEVYFYHHPKTSRFFVMGEEPKRCVYIVMPMSMN